jgi:hypothetical protein
MPTSDPAPAGIGHNSGDVLTVLRDSNAGLILEVNKLPLEVKAFIDGLGDAGSVETDEQFAAAVKLGKDARALEGDLDTTKLATTKPLRDEVGQTNAFFDALKVAVSKQKAIVLTLIDDFNKRKREREAREAADAARRAQEEARRKLEEATEAQHSVVGDIALQEAVKADRVAQRMEHKALNAGTGPARTSAGTVSTTTNWTHRVDDWSRIDLRELRESFSVADIEKAIRAHVRKNKNTKPLAGVTIYPEETTRLR